MAIEVRTHLRVYCEPVEPEDVARKVDIGAFGALAPDNPSVGSFWARPDAALFVWTGSDWLQLIAPSLPTEQAVWDDGATVWDDGNTIWDA